MKYAVTGKDIPQEQELFNSLWAILKRFYRITNDNESDLYWEQLVAETNAIYNRMPANTPLKQFGKEMILSELAYLEALAKENTHNTHNT